MNKFYCYSFEQRERERETERQRERETDRQTDRDDENENERGSIITLEKVIHFYPTSPFLRSNFISRVRGLSLLHYRSISLSFLKPVLTFKTSFAFYKLYDLQWPGKRSDLLSILLTTTYMHAKNLTGAFSGALDIYMTYHKIGV